MTLISIGIIFLAGLLCIFAYPLDLRPYYDEDSLPSLDQQLLLQGYPNKASSMPTLDLDPFSDMSMAKRGRAAYTNYKRSSLNRLLQRLIALYGNNDINFSGRSSHVRFGAGGR